MIEQRNAFQAQNTTYTQSNVVKAFMTSVFSWMFLALAVSGVTAYFFAADSALIGSLYDLQTGRPNLLGWVVTFAPFGFVLMIFAGMHRLSFGTLSLLFMVFSILMGISLSYIILAYTSKSIFLTFVITSGTFGAMALLGFTTKTDLSKFGSILMMGLVGIIIASVVNIFMGSSQLDYIISFIGVIVFTGLTAYDVQKLKRIAQGQHYGQYTMNKLVILGALNLYLDFINLFLFLLRFLGDRK